MPVALLLAVVLTSDGGATLAPSAEVRATVLAGQALVVDVRDAGNLSIETPDAGTTYVSFSDPLYSTCPAAPPVQVVTESNRAGIANEILHGSFDGYALVTQQRQSRIACLMATCDEDRHRRAEEMNVAPPWWWIALSSAVVVSAATAFTIGRFTAPAPAPTSPSP